MDSRRSNADGRKTNRRRERRSGRADGATRAHNTLSSENTHVQVFYPFHPLCGVNLQVIRRPKRGDGAVSVLDLAGRRLKIPLWMLSPDCAEIKVSDKAHLSKGSLIELTVLLNPMLDNAGKNHDNLLQNVDKCKGGHRAATTASESDRNERIRDAHRSNGSRRTSRSHGSHSDGGLSNRRRKT